MRKSDVATANVSVGEIPAPASAIDVRSVLFAMQAVRAGDFSVRLPGDRTGLEGKFSDTFDDIVDTCERMSRELKQMGQTVGRAGKTQRRAKFGPQAAPLGGDGDLDQYAESMISCGRPDPGRFGLLRECRSKGAVGSGVEPDGRGFTAEPFGPQGVRPLQRQPVY